MPKTEHWFCSKCNTFVAHNDFCRGCGGIPGSRLLRTYNAPIISQTLWRTTPQQA